MRTSQSGIIYKLIRKMMKLKFITIQAIIMAVRMLKGGPTKTMIINVIANICLFTYVMKDVR